MTSRSTKVSNSVSPSPARRLRPSAAAAVSRCVAEFLEDRKLFAVGLVSVGIDGPANGDSGEASVSLDGRYVVFSSFASNLVANDTNNKQDVFLRDRQAGTTTLISKNPTTGEVGNGESNQPVISQDGTFVAFSSRANNLLANDTLGFSDIIRYNIATGALELVSVSRDGGFANKHSGEPTISKTGQFVSFTSFAANVAPSPPFADGNAENDVFVRDMTAGTTKLISVAQGNVQAGNAQSFDSWISEDGRYVTFRSDANNLVAGDTNVQRDTFLRDTVTNTTTLISANRTNTGGGNQGSESNSVSGDGRFVTFQSKADDLVANDGNVTTDVFLRDTTTNTTRLLSINRFGTSSAGGFSEFPAMSQDGSYASFSSFASDIVEGDGNGREDVFVRDLARGPLYLLSRNTSGAPANGRSFDPFINRNGTHVVFTSDGNDLSAGDTNGKFDVFVADIPQAAGQGDTTPPTATFGSVATASPGATSVEFTVNLADNVGLNTVSVGALQANKTGGGALPATLVSVVGTGATAVATYRVDFGTPVEQNTGTYTISVPAGAIKDAAGNSAAAGNLAGVGTGGATFDLGTGTPGGGTGGTIGDPNGPNLVVIAPSRIPGAAIGSVSKGKLKWKVRNDGPGILNPAGLPPAATTFTVSLSADPTLDAGDVQVATVTKTLKKLRVGKAKGLSAKWVYPGNVGNGNYYLLVKADSANAVAESNEADNVTPSATTILVQAPFVDLQPTFVSKPSRITPGAAIVVTATVKNNGNVAFKGAVPINLVSVVQADPINGTARVIGNATPTLSLKPGKSKTVKFSTTLPADLAPATYELGVIVDTANQFAESDEGNNTARSFVFTV